MKWFFFLAIAVFMSGCGESQDKIDGTSRESYAKSCKGIMDSLSQTRKLEFASALTNLGIMHFSEKRTPEENASEVWKHVHGKTASEVINEAQNLNPQELLQQKRRVLEYNRQRNKSR